MLRPFLLLALLSPATLAHADKSIGTYSKCNRSDDEAACKACLGRGGGVFYNYDDNTKAWVCGPTSDMKPPKPVAKPPAVKKPALNKHFSTYATIQPGTTQLGSGPAEGDRDGNEKRTTVKLTRAFLIKTTEVTQNEWFNVMGSQHASYQAGCGMDCPVAEVSWFEAIEYLNKLSQREKLEQCYDTSGTLPVWTKELDCKGYRLPTEAEWVMAARGGSIDDVRHGEVDDIAWTDENSGGTAHPVATKQPNAFGLYDMLGNVAEMVYDAWDYKTPAPGSVDPIRHEIGEAAMTGDRTRCGGDFREGARRARNAARQAFPGATRSRGIGFRPVRTK